jgi:hypothetical protein
MIWMLRNISIHLWITTLVVLPVCFYILPVLIRFFPQIDPMSIGIVLIVLAIFGISFLMNLSARKILAGLLMEGQAWERAGIANKAEKQYTRAVRLFDSFLLWPLSAGKTAQKIAGVVARFQLNTGCENENFKRATCDYLKMNPEDKEIARLWLKRLRMSSVVTQIEQDILSVLAEVYHGDIQLSPMIADIFLGLERRDFAAHKLYSQMKNEPALGEKYSKKIEDVIGPTEDETLGHKIFFTENEDQPESYFSGFKQSGKHLKKRFGITRQIKLMADSVVSGLKWGRHIIGSAISSLRLTLIKTYGYIKDHEQVRFYLKTGMMIMVSGWLVYFMVGTMSHLFKSKPVEKEEQLVVEQIPKPYTIQVAAYIKQVHADHYVDILKKKGIQASVKKVVGGGKTWFVVLVSEFSDKKSAAEYGNKLKRQKIIDDFFVNNK